MFKRSLLTGLAISLLVVQACGSDDGKKRVQNAGEGGAAGEAGADSGMDAAGAAGEAPLLPAAGMSGSGGAGGQAPVDPTGGTGGEPVVVVTPDPELLFSVKPGAVGLPSTDVSTQASPQNFIYSSKTGSQDLVNGTNSVKITGESLGLAAADQIVAFALPQAEPKNPTYLFSIAEGSEGGDRTRTYASYWREAGGAHTGEGDVYYSDGVQSFRDYGEGGDDFGYNAMLATELSLGLSKGDGVPDDLTGLAAHDANAPITELYFTVSSAAEGADGSAVSTVDATERGCTIFKSTLDGDNEVAFSCADLGLLGDSDQVDALAVYGTAGAKKIVFSVTSGSQGIADSAVEATRLADNGQVGCTLFGSAGDGANTVFKAAGDLGLGEFAYVDDEIDGLAVIDTAKGKATKAGSCELTYDPYDTTDGAGLQYINGATGIGANVLVLHGTMPDDSTRLLAYNATTCAFLAQVDFPQGFGSAIETAIVPLAGWSVAKPFEKVEYLSVVGDQVAGLKLNRSDATGTFVQAFPIANTQYYWSIHGLVYEAANDRLYLLLGESPDRTVRVVPRPDASVTLLDAPAYDRTHPCGYYADVRGTDAVGNLVIGQAPRASEGDYRVCTVTPFGELQPEPYSWTATPAGGYGVITPNGSHFLVRDNGPANPVEIERGTYQAP